jgi:hypothetical protein
MSVRHNLEAFGTYKTTTNERKGTLYSTETRSIGSLIDPADSRVALLQSVLYVITMFCRNITVITKVFYK